MEYYSVFDPAFSSFGRLVPGYDTAGLEQALFARRQPEEGMALVSRFADPRLRLTANTLKKQLVGDAPASVVLYTGRNTSPRRLLRSSHGAYLIGAYDFVLLVTSKEEVSKRRLDSEQMTAFFVPGRVLIQLYDATLHCVPCHTHDRDGMNVLVIRPAGTLRTKAKQDTTTLARKLAPKLTSKSPEGAPTQPRLMATIHRAPKKPTVVPLLKALDPEEDREPQPVSIRLKQGVTTLRGLSARRLLGKLRWRSHIAAKLRTPPEDL